MEEWNAQYQLQFSDESRDDTGGQREQKAEASTRNSPPYPAQLRDDISVSGNQRQFDQLSEPNLLMQTPKSREGERMKFGPWPKPANFRQWRMAVIHEVVAFSSDPTIAFQCINELRTQNACYEYFKGTSYDNRISMATLDAKLASALAHSAPDDFQRTLHVNKQEALARNAMVTGRQILFLIDQHFRMTEADGAVYDTEHLLSVQIRGERLQESLSTWDTVLAGLRNPPMTQCSVHCFYAA